MAFQEFEPFSYGRSNNAEQAMRLTVGAATLPLWAPFIAATSVGVSWWWATAWARELPGVAVMFDGSRASAAKEAGPLAAVERSSFAEAQTPAPVPVPEVAALVTSPVLTPAPSPLATSEAVAEPVEAPAESAAEVGAEAAQVAETAMQAAVDSVMESVSVQPDAAAEALETLPDAILAKPRNGGGKKKRA
jgi:hypothetical protein